MKANEVFLFCLPGTNLEPAGQPRAAAEYVNERKANWQRRPLMQLGLACLVLWPQKQGLRIYGAEPGKH